AAIPSVRPADARSGFSGGAHLRDATRARPRRQHGIQRHRRVHDGSHRGERLWPTTRSISGGARLHATAHDRDDVQSATRPLEARCSDGIRLDARWTRARQGPRRARVLSGRHRSARGAVQHCGRPDPLRHHAPPRRSARREAYSSRGDARAVHRLCRLRTQQSGARLAEATGILGGTAHVESRLRPHRIHGDIDRRGSGSRCLHHPAVQPGESDPEQSTHQRRALASRRCCRLGRARESWSHHQRRGPMTFTVVDWAIVAAYFILSAGIGFAFTKKGGESLSEYFLSGRQVPWWLAGASMVATTFAADTPLVVTGMVATKGVAGNWLWWCFVMSGMLTVFFFARLWRRAHVMTDIEFVEVRYSGRPATFLRGFRAIYLGVFVNLIILGWVTKAMIKILGISLGVNPYVAVGICFVITVAYSVAAGMWAVLWTDLVQFVIKMTAVIVLAVFAVRAVGGMDALKSGLVAHFGSQTAALSVLPVAVRNGGIQAYIWMPAMTIGV